MNKYFIIMMTAAMTAGSLFSQDSSNEPPRIPAVTNPSVPSPKGFRNFKEVKGDLDGDGIHELLIAYETDKEANFGKERQIHIFKKEDKKWKLHKKFTGTLLPSEQGGAMGDSFQDIQIKKGVIVIEQNGGSSKVMLTDPENSKIPGSKSGSQSQIETRMTCLYII